jgi:hypothetical protein
MIHNLTGLGAPVKAGNPILIVSIVSGGPNLQGPNL